MFGPTSTPTGIYILSIVDKAAMATNQNGPNLLFKYVLESVGIDIEDGRFSRLFPLTSCNSG